MYTLILVWSINYSSNGGTESLQVNHLTYQECSTQIKNFKAGAEDLQLKYSACINEGVKQ